jgi:hypothetical protein
MAKYIPPACSCDSRMDDSCHCVMCVRRQVESVDGRTSVLCDTCDREVRVFKLDDFDTCVSGTCSENSMCCGAASFCNCIRCPRTRAQGARFFRCDTCGLNESPMCGMVWKVPLVGGQIVPDKLGDSVSGAAPTV